MKIGVLGWDHGAEDPDSPNLARMGTELGHETSLFTLEEIDYETRDGAVQVSCGGTPATEFDAIISRANLYGEWQQNLYDGWPDRVERLTMLSNVPGVRLFDPVGVWLTGYSKLRQAQALTAAGVPTPPVRSARSVEDVAVAVEQFGGQAIVKPSCGLRGIDVELVDDAERRRSSIDELLGRYGTLACQPFYPTWFGEFRVVVAGDVAPLCMYKLPAAGEWKCKTLEGASFEQWQPSDELLDIAFRATRALGMTMGHLDILTTEDGYAVLEVNVVGGFLEIFGPDVHRATLTGVYDWVVKHTAQRA